MIPVSGITHSLCIEALQPNDLKSNKLDYHSSLLEAVYHTGAKEHMRGFI